MPEESQDPRLRSLLRLAREVTARRDLDDVLAQAIRGLRSMVSFTGASILLVDDEGAIMLAASDPPPSPEALDRRIPMGTSVAGRVILTEQAVYISDLSVDPRPTVFVVHDWAGDILSYFAVPLLVDGRAIGVLRLDDTRSSAFTESDRLLIAATATTIAAAIQNARAYARVASARKAADRFATL
jgi:GAF domain-containing protein